MAAFDTEVVVVGAGVMGLATARELAQAGRDVIVCEQFELGHTHGSSHGSSRIVRLSYPDRRWVRMAQESFPLWRQLESECGRPLLELRGSLDLGDWELHRDALAACGASYEVLDAAEIERRFPIRAEAGSRGLFQADGGIVLADAAAAAFAAGAVSAGAQVRESHRVEAVEEDSTGVAVGGLRARVAVVTAGAWAPTLAGVDAVPTIETVSYFDFPEPIPSVIDTTAGDRSGYALAAPGGALKAGLHQAGLRLSPDEVRTPNRELALNTAAWVESRFGIAEPATRLETCLYTRRQDDEFLIERRGRVVIGSPCSGHGFKFAPVVGRRLAALAAEVLAAKQPL